MALKLVQYVKVAVLDEKNMEVRSSASIILGDLLAKAGEDDCDTILECIGQDNITPLYKWNKERDCWQMLA